MYHICVASVGCIGLCFHVVGGLGLICSTLFVDSFAWFVCVNSLVKG